MNDFEDQEELYDEELDMEDEDETEESMLETKQQPEYPEDAVSEQASNEPSVEKAVSALDKMPYKTYISYLYSEFCNMHKGIAGLEEEWAKVRAQVNSALQLQVPREYITPLISLEYNYEQREVIKYMLFAGASGDLVKQMLPSLSYKEMIARFDASKVESAVTNLLDTPLNTMSKLVNDYKEDLMRFRAETEQKITDYEQQIKDKDAELSQTANELKALKELLAEDEKKKAEEQKIRAEAEKLASDMFREQKKQFEAENRHNQELEELYLRIRQLEAGSVPGGKPLKEKKRFGFGKKKAEGVQPKKIDNLPLPKDFDISAYMMQSSLSSSQLDVISLAVKCGLSDKVVKDMIDSGKDARQLKQIVEVYLAKRDRELQDKAAKEHIVNQEDIMYDE